MTSQLGSRNSVWRPSVALRIAAVAFALGSIALGAWVIAVAAGEGAWLQGLAFVAAFFWLPAAVGLRFALRARLEVAEEELVVTTTFSEHRIPWTSIRGAEPEYAGIRVYLHDGSWLLAGAVQKSNLAVWMRRTTRADEVAGLIQQRSTDVGPLDG